MTTVVERTPEGVIYRAAKPFPVPDLDILSLLFDSKHSAATPESVIHVSADDPSLQLNVSRARTLTHATSAALRRHFSIGAGGPGRDIVSVVSLGHYLLPVLCYGIIGAGGVLSAAAAASTPSELARQLSSSESKILCCVEALKDVAVKAVEEAGWGRGGGGRVLIMGEGKEWTLKVVQGDGSLGRNLINENDLLPWQAITDRKTLEDSFVIMIYSSGTTGLPKGVKLSHRNLVAQTVIPGDLLRQSWGGSQPKWDYRTLAHLPMAHIAGIQGYLINPFYVNGTVYWMPRFDWPKFLQYNKQYKITIFFTAPPIYLMITKSPDVKDHFASLVRAISGAAPLGKELQHAASRKLGTGQNVFISQTWGLSETCGSATLMPPGIDDDTGSVSALMPNMEARIVDDEDRDVEPGQPGEVLLRGPVVCNGYYKNEAADRESFTKAADGGRWFRTGDVAHVRDGLIYIIDRKKELIKYKGLQVAPAELEALLLTHPAVLDAAVIGVPAVEGDETSEVPRAYVVADRKKIDAEAIKDFVKRNAANHKQLRGGVVFVDAIPKSPAGKILRRDLRAMATRGQSKL
ncbi:4-coumaryl-CoA ligase [Pyricularia oryzae 70-15]|uniref:4-coumaryl-CoA ligase n=1 Tax=Pyricularia oryzae (strain 70-15 / ATCC MYA-4617 / FGSC 8958) TaxID=242507 RepID=G4MPB2_PYRO7|nr:4-coumaryl-CoA ligase [Pyricularia oryzae 70-15]EHA57165.1 4-coumaryl-CoA ligase [Pyricularia oryzae 70-15]